MLSLRTLSFISILLIAMLISGCQHTGLTGPNSIFKGRYSQYMRGNIPDQYDDLKNTLPASAENIYNGKKLYQMQCLGCHGKSGKGDGPAGKQLAVRPANLAFTRRLPVTTDAFFFWTISEGGKSFGSAMPAFSEQLSDNEIWQITHYINTGFKFNQGI